MSSTPPARLAVASVNYDAEHAAISFLFLDRLPEGRYTIKMDADHPLVDLAGIAPTSPGRRQRACSRPSPSPPTFCARADDGSLAVADATGEENDATRWRISARSPRTSSWTASSERSRSSPARAWRSGSWSSTATSTS